MSYTPPAGDAANFSWGGLSAYTAPAGDAADFSFEQGSASVSAWGSALGPLGAALALARVVSASRASAPSPLGSPEALARQAPFGFFSMGTPLGAGSIFAGEESEPSSFTPTGFSLTRRPQKAGAVTVIYDGTGYFSTTNGTAWTALPATILGQSYASVWSDGNGFLAYLNDNTVARSDDALASWAVVGTLPSTAFLDNYPEPVGAGGKSLIYATTDGQVRALESLDGGATWEQKFGGNYYFYDMPPVAAGGLFWFCRWLSSASLRYAAGETTGTSTVPWVDGDGPGYLLEHKGDLYVMGGEATVYRSTDGGLTFPVLTSEIDAADSWYEGASSNGELVFFGGENSLIFSATDGLTWESVDLSGIIPEGGWLYTLPHFITPTTLLLFDLYGGESYLMEVEGVGEAEPVESLASAPSVLGWPRGVVFHDFTANLGDAVQGYEMGLETAQGLISVPISSWQATLQTRVSNYVQCVVPAAQNWAEAIQAATAFVILRTATLPTGEKLVYEMARAPVGEARFDWGPGRYTATVSGYSQGFAVDEEGELTATRTLTGIRSVSFGNGGRRIRCSIDWLLRPGQMANADGMTFTVSYMNFYVSGNDAYMDAGERV
jgi:hypothetical protein